MKKEFGRLRSGNMVKNYWYSKQRRQRVGLDLHSSKDVPELDDKEVTSEEELNEPFHNNAISFMIVKFLSRDFIMKKS